MAQNYVIAFKDTTQTSLAATDIIQIEIRSTAPIGGAILGEDWIFFYTTNPPVVWDDVAWSGRLADIKSWRVQF